MFNSDFPTVLRKVSLISVYQIKSAVYELIINSTIKPCQYRVFIALHFKVVVGDVCRCISVLISSHCVKHSSHTSIPSIQYLHIPYILYLHILSIQYLHIPSIQNLHIAVRDLTNSARPEGECTMCQILAWHTQIVTLL